MRRPFAKSLSEFLPGALDPLAARLGLSQAALITNWPEIAGERLAAVCEPVRLIWPACGPRRDPDKPTEPATLVLRAAPGFALELQHLAPVLLARVNAHLGWRAADRVQIRQEPLRRREKPARKRLAIDPQARAQAQAATQNIEDAALRAALARLGAALLSERAAKGD